MIDSPSAHRFYDLAEGYTLLQSGRRIQPGIYKIGYNAGNIFYFK